MKLLLLSNSRNPDQDYLEHALPWMREHFEGVKTVLFVAYADIRDPDASTEKVSKAFATLGITIVAAHKSLNPVELLQQVDGVYVGGGNTFVLRDELYKTGMLDAIAEKVKAGMPYMGASAGTNVSCPAIKTTNDMPIIETDSLLALGLINFQINPHYQDPDPESKHMGETREMRISEFHIKNAMPVLGLREGSALRVTDNVMEILGSKTARLFQQNKSAVEVNPGSDISFLIETKPMPVQSSATMRTLYPESLYKCHREFPLTVGDATANESHRLYIAEYGNPAGIPVVVCHGGPGAGSTPKYARFFHPDKYRVILYDQRGAGKSTPKYCMENNTTQDHIADMEKIRVELGIEKWVVFGGSWGSTLSLLYAEAHPENVLGLILRGIWLARNDEVYGYLRADKPGPKLMPAEWRAFKAGVSDLVAESKLEIETDDMIDVLYELITKSSEDIKERTAKLVAKWEYTVCFLKKYSDAELNQLAQDFGIGMAIAEITYKKFRCFIRENQILEDIHKLKGIPMYIVHGLYDICTPSDQMWDLVDAHKKVNGEDAIVCQNIAGHAAFEEGNTDGLVRFSDAMLATLALGKIVGFNQAASGYAEMSASTFGSGGRVSEGESVDVNPTVAHRAF